MPGSRDMRASEPSVEVASNVAPSGDQARSSTPSTKARSSTSTGSYFTLLHKVTCRWYENLDF